MFSKKEEPKKDNVKEFVCKVPPCTFSIPARPTVRQQMEYFSASAGAKDKEMLARYWEGAKVMIRDWKSETVKDFKIDLDSIDDPVQAEVIIWASVQVKQYMDNLESVPKN